MFLFRAFPGNLKDISKALEEKNVDCSFVKNSDAKTKFISPKISCGPPSKEVDMTKKQHQRKKKLFQGSETCLMSRID